MVEFAMVFPLLLMVVLGIIEFGRFFFVYSSVVSASREAARYGAAIQDIGGGIAQYEDCQGIRDAAVRVGGVAGISENDVEIKYADSTGIYSTSCPPSQEVRQEDRIIVSISTVVNPLVPIVNIPPIPVEMASNRTILKEIALGRSGTGAGAIAGSITDVNFKTTAQTAEETKGTLSVDLVLNQVIADDVTVPFSVTGTAVDGTDYNITSSPVVIPAGSQSVKIYISLIHDGIDEGAESLVIGIGNPTNATKGPQNIHTITIQDPPKVNFSEISCTKNENAGSTGVMLELSKASSQDITVPYSFSGSASWGATADYTTGPNPIVIPAGSLTQMINVTIHDDLIDEYDEVATLELGTPTNALLGGQTTHSLTILDDDAPPEVMFYLPALTISEEVGVFTTTLKLSSISGKEIQVPYTLSGTTTEEDYNVHQPSPLTIPPGNQTVDLSFDILEGDGWEEDETLIIDLDSPVNATKGVPGTQTVTITEDTLVPDVSFEQSYSSVLEDGGRQTIGVSLSNGWFDDITVHYSLAGTASEGDGGDYFIAASPLVIPSGFLRGEITLDLVDDIISEDDETITITIDSVENGNMGEALNHTMTVGDNDPIPEVSFGTPQQSVTEGNTTVSINVNLSVPSSKTIAVPFSFAGSASAGYDYSPATTELTLAPGVTSDVLTVDILDDALYDPDETVLISIGSPTNAILGEVSEHSIKINDDELPPCDVKDSLLTVGTSSITWTFHNAGQEVTFTGGSVTWPEASIGKPRLANIYFSGAEVYSGNDKPTSVSYAASEVFPSESDTNLGLVFSEAMGVGQHTLVATFQNAQSGDSCSLTKTYNKH